MDIERKRPNAAIISIVVIVLIAIAAGAAYAGNAAKQHDSEQMTVSSSTQPTSDTSTSNSVQDTKNQSTNGIYKDGSYTATGTYTTPGGSESITVTVTLAGNKISDINATGSASRGDSGEYQSRFLSGYKSQVVGKSIDSVSLSRVAGSSLTSNGFNAAIEKIKNESVS